MGRALVHAARSLGIGRSGSVAQCVDQVGSEQPESPLRHALWNAVPDPEAPQEVCDLALAEGAAVLALDVGLEVEDDGFPVDQRHGYRARRRAAFAARFLERSRFGRPVLLLAAFGSAWVAWQPGIRR
jgi:hypothetical protein